MLSNLLRMQFKKLLHFLQGYRGHIFNNTKAYTSMSSNLGQFCNFPDMFLYILSFQVSCFLYTRIFLVSYKTVNLDKKANMICQK